MSKTLSVLELWHGPTCAFKDMALQILPEFMVGSLAVADEKNEILILTATSGDTGKAALEGFKNKKGIKIMVFYPENGVSEMQKYQMITQEGDNVSVVAVKGNFDDAQTGVKEIFTDKEFNEMLYRKATGCLLQTPSTGEDYCLKSSIISTPMEALLGRM